MSWHVYDDQWENAAAKAARHSPRSHVDARDHGWLVGDLQFLDGDVPYVPIEKPLREIVGIDDHGEAIWDWSAEPVEQSMFVRGAQCSIFEFADDMALVFGPEVDDAPVLELEDGFFFLELFGQLHITFVHETSWTTITANDAAPGWKIQVPRAEVQPGIERFLREFANEVATRIPAFTEWETFRPLMAWR